MKIFEITTIAGPVQRYEVIEVSPYTFANGAAGVSIRTIEKDHDSLDNPAATAHHIYSLTGLDDAIKRYPPLLLTEHNGERFTGAEIARPERLRIIYDALPFGHHVPIMRICPSKGELYVAEYDFKKAKLPLEAMTVSNEFEGSLNLRFTGLEVFLHMRNFEEENEDYYGRKLKESRVKS